MLGKEIDEVALCFCLSFFFFILFFHFFFFDQRKLHFSLSLSLSHLFVTIGVFPAGNPGNRLLNLQREKKKMEGGGGFGISISDIAVSE